MRTGKVAKFNMRRTEEQLVRQIGQATQENFEHRIIRLEEGLSVAQRDITDVRSLIRRAAWTLVAVLLSIVAFLVKKFFLNS